MNKGASENPLGFGLVIVGAIGMSIAVFLPLVEPIGPFGRVSDNTLIQHGGWVLIALALGIAASGYRVSQGTRGARWVPLILCGLALAFIVYTANDKDTRTLYPVRPDRTVDTSQPGMVADLGIAVYVAGAGGAVAIIGSLILLRSAQRPAPDDPVVAAGAGKATTKKCPDCAETILADAKVCKHCGYRFSATAPVASAPQKAPTGASTKMKCVKCNHVQEVPRSQKTWQCPQCKTILKRKTKQSGEK
jgi:predicted RNA-binding Zn-ribbon protein involved in translation (DUF1610 family)